MFSGLVFCLGEIQCHESAFLPDTVFQDCFSCYMEQQTRYNKFIVKKVQLLLSYHQLISHWRGLSRKQCSFQKKTNFVERIHFSPCGCHSSCGNQWETLLSEIR